MQLNIYFRNNDLLEAGNIDVQIVSDLEKYIEDRKRYQEEYLDIHIRGISSHYEMWTMQNQSMIKYTERILECVKLQMKM